MIKVGFIDYYLDEWHANNYPNFFKTKTNGRYEVCCAYAEIDSPIGGMTSKQWSEKYGIPLADTIQEVIDKSDVLIVLSPDTPEMHEKLTELPLQSGKLVYVDKTFAPDKETAKRIFENADKHNTKCFSTSSLRFSSEIQDIDMSKVYRICSDGCGLYENYSIHQIEPIVKLMNSRAKRVMFTGTMGYPSMIIEFENGKIAEMRQCYNTDFKITTIDNENNAKEYPITCDYTGLFMDELIKYFDTGVVPVSHEETIDVIGIIKAGHIASEKPFTWVEV